MSTVGKLGTPKQIREMPDWITYEDIMEFLKLCQEYPGVWEPRKYARRLRDARLTDNQLVIKVVGNDDWGDRFNELAEAIGYGEFARVYRVTDKLLYDINTVRDWISDYNTLLKYDFGSYGIAQLTVLGQAILGRAIELCPLETGALRASGRLVVFKDRVMITFDCPYASYVHEDMSKNHPIGQAKFLEQAAQELIPYQTTWVERHEDGGVWIMIGIDYKVEYGHYNT